RQAHMDHHLYLNTARDPDIILSQPEESGRKLLANLLQDLVFVLAVKRFLQYFQSDPSNYSVLPWRTLSVAYFTRMLKPIGLVILAQAGLFLVFAMTAGPTFYLWFHVLPIMTLYPFQIRVRSIAEHSFEPGYAPRLSDDIWVARTSRLNMFERIIVAPFGQRYHYEHHVFPGVPNCNLAKVHRLLIDAGIPVPVNTSYFGFVTRKILMDLSGTAK
ncbi:MAG TPA: fatty acid desaturase, partial [Methylomirabilota bacterium]|nr:fatty acid desaturase [Methylomirabilota bacterium]